MKVELLLVDWLPRKVIAASEYLGLAPGLLRAFIAFAHDESGTRTELTDEALAAVDDWEPQFQQLIRSARPQGVDAVLAALGLGDDDEDADLDLGIGDIILEYVEKRVGGRGALDSLDDRPLPDEPFCWDAIPADVVDRVGEVVELVDRCCDELLGTEYRTACRRLLARLAAPGEAFRRKGKPQTAAAAVVWIIGKVNDLFGPRGIQVNEVMRHFGLTGSVSQRAETLMRGAGIPYTSYDLSLGSPDYLVSSKRRWIIEQRDHFRSTEV